MFNCDNLYFNVIGSVNEEKFKITQENDFDFVVCLYSNNQMSLLRHDLKKSVLARLISPVNLDKLCDNNYQQLPHLTKEKIKTLKDAFKKKKKVRKSDTIEKLCKCDICKKNEFDENMSKAGPEQLDIVELQIINLLEILNLNSSENIKIIEDLCEHSVAAFDIESMTVNSDHVPPEDFFSIDSIDTRGTETFIQKIQKPIMISHCDALSESEGIDLTFTTISDNEEDIYKMMIAYWNCVCTQSELSVKQKMKIASPLFASIKKYSQEFFDLCAGLKKKQMVMMVT